MRLWSIHPKYLDARGLVALWREGLLAQAVLRGQTKGYLHHPQLKRFRSAAAPLGVLAEYLRVVQAEALRRNYVFDVRKISRARAAGQLVVTRGQIDYEWQHLLAKLAKRDSALHARFQTVRRPEPHPVFRVKAGAVESWEKRIEGH